MSVVCSGKTASGRRCKHPAGASGFCKVHDPRVLADRRKQAAEQAAKSERLSEVLEKVYSAAKATGWTAWLTHRDNEGHRYASVEVRKTFNNNQVGGTVDVSVTDGGIKVSRNKTSFYGYGLDALHEAIIDAVETLGWVERRKPSPQGTPVPPVRETIDGMLRRFDRFARQLSRRHANRTGILIADEYDAQDLVHALLRAVADDVRAEEVTPSYAGGSSRLDFLLKKEKIVIELKFATQTLRDAKIGEELIVDIARYRTHPDCKTLLCLVYDPGNHIKNPHGLETDLSGATDGLDVRVYVVPH